MNQDCFWGSLGGVWRGVRGKSLVCIIGLFSRTWISVLEIVFCSSFFANNDE